MYRKYLICAALLMGAVSCSKAAEPLTIEQKAAKMLIVGVQGQSLSKTNPIIGNIKDDGVSGIILFGHNLSSADGVDSRAQLKKFVGDLKAVRDEKLFVSIDQEGGRVNRLKSSFGFEDMPSAKSVGERGTDEYAHQSGALIASEVASVGINFNFAPCIDVDVNPESPAIGFFSRSFSPNENEVARYGAIYVEEHRKNGVLTSLKHFPGHGSALKDSHHGLTDISNTWSEKELVPYKKLIGDGLCDAVMVSHLYNSKFDKEYPATLSKPTIDSLLRGVMGWDGVVVTDDMQMKAITEFYGFDEAVVLAINAGVDLFIIGNNIVNDGSDVVDRFIAIVTKAVESGKIDVSTLDQAVERIEKLRSKLVF